jgi:hypothetical protein
MAEDTEARTSFAWAGTGGLAPTYIEDNVETLVGLDERTLTRSLSDVAPHLAEAKARLTEEMARHPMDRIFSYVHDSEIIHKDGTKIPIENIIVVLRRNNGDAPLVVGVVRACELCPFLRRIGELCRSLDDAGRRLALRLVQALAAA